MQMQMEATLTNSMPENADPSQPDTSAVAVAVAAPAPFVVVFVVVVVTHTHLAAVFNTFRKLTLHLHVTMTRQTHMEHRPHDHRR